MMCKVLIFSCISAVMLMTTAYGASLATEKDRLLKALIKDLKFLEKSKNKIHLDLYTPNEKQECSWHTLQCYLTEMGTLENEIEDEDFHNLRNIKMNLQSLMDLTPQGTGCKICEAHDKKRFPAFHQELNNFLISMLK
ncbi:interleukin-15 [Columba livia]|uniref:Interleukin n=1 Tax=Columba livia TaxID=8932 RepID=A0A2I0MGL8_COLLI|nr:interleukin-15 [Columba livia]KAK2519269.1 Il21 [Columba guinea]PKK28831.1 interleukin-15 [Columba livia]